MSRINVGLIVEHHGDGAVYLIEGVVAHDGKGNTGRSEVLLSTAIYADVLAEVDGA